MFAAATAWLAAKWAKPLIKAAVVVTVVGAIFAAGWLAYEHVDSKGYARAKAEFGATTTAAKADHATSTVVNQQEKKDAAEIARLKAALDAKPNACVLSPADADSVR
jgi:predicted negative regulator of RcsB-dependent stress response